MVFFNSSSGEKRRSSRSTSHTLVNLRNGPRLILAIVGLLYMTLPHVQGVNPVALVSEPDTVQHKGADLKIWGNFEETLDEDGYLEITVPELVAIVGTGPYQCFDSENKETCTATLKSSSRSFQISPKKAYTEKGEYFQFTIKGAIDNPDSVKRTQSFQITTSNHADNLGTAELTAKKGGMEKFKLTPKDLEVGRDTFLTVTFTANEAIPVGGLIVMTFPPWDPENDQINKRASYIAGNPECSPNPENLALSKEDLGCTFKNNQLKLVNGVKKRITKGTEVSFVVTGTKNPIESGITEGFSIFTAIQGCEYLQEDKENEIEALCLIDEATTTLEATEYSLLVGGIIDVDDKVKHENSGEIQEFDRMQLNFNSVVPINGGCIVTVVLPDHYNINQVTKVQKQGLFGARNNSGYTEENGLLTKNTEKNSFTIKPCEDQKYYDNNQKAIIFIESLQHFKYAKESASFKVYIDSNDGRKIAKVESRVTFIPENGSIEVLDATAQFPTVQAETEITFKLIPEHDIYKEDEPVLEIIFPSQIDRISQRCDAQVKVSDQTAPPPPQGGGPSCQPIGQSMQITNWLPEDYIPRAATESNPVRYIEVTVSKVKNNESIDQPLGLKIAIYANKQGKLYDIDEFEGRAPWKLQPGDFAPFPDGEVTPLIDLAYADEVLYTFKFQPDHGIPKYGYITVDFPHEIEIPDESYTQSQCKAQQGFSDQNSIELKQLNQYKVQINCQFTEIEDPQRPGEYTKRLSIMNGFMQKGSDAKTPYVFTIPGLRNPKTLRMTDTFVFRTYTRIHQLIDESTSPYTVTMETPASLQTAKVSLTSYTNSKKNDYTFTLVPSVPVIQSNYLQIAFPDSIELPSEANQNQLACSTSFHALIEKVQCSRTEKTLANGDKLQAVRIDLTLAQGVEQIRPLARFDVTLKSIRNPISTRTTSSIQISILEDNIPVNQKNSGITVTTHSPSILDRAGISLESPQPGMLSDVIINIWPEHNIQAGGGILVVYPVQMQPDDNKEKDPEKNPKLEIELDGVPLTGFDSVFDASARSIRVRKLFQGAPFVAAGQMMTVTVKGLRNPLKNELTESFIIQTFNYDSGYFYIDAVNEGLSINAECNYPCKTCSADDPTRCLSCQEDEKDGPPKLQEGTCQTECSKSRFYNLEKSPAQCELCDDTCLTCSERKGKCTECGVDDYLYLFKPDNTCVQDCAPGYLGDSGRNECVECDDNCLTCSLTTDMCTACDKRGKEPWLFKGTCRAECLADYSVAVGDSCVECDSTCKTCAGATDQCTSCESHMRYDDRKKTCTAACEDETQIYIAAANGIGGSCEYCQEDCEKCAGSVNECTLCKADFLLNVDLTCKPTCSAVNQTPVDGVCKECDEPCATCEISTQMCTSCTKPYLLFQGQNCVQYCPEKWVASADGTKCIAQDLICPDGFSPNKMGDGCVPTKFDCATGMMINETKTACIPAPGSPIPFPFLLLSIFLSFLVLGGYLKDKHVIKVTTCLISLIGSMELIIYCMMIGYSISNEQWIPMVFSIAGFGAMVGSNVIMFVYYKKEILSKDPAYLKWLKFFPKTAKIMPLMCLVVNFKCFKMVYSGFFSLESTMAKFSNPKLVFRIMRMTTYFSFIFSYGFIFIADILILIYSEWGYQLYILAIESLVLQILIIVLTIIEFRHGPNYLNCTRGNSLVKASNRKPLRVMGAVEEEDYEEGIPDMDEKTLIRARYEHEEREVNLRKVALSRLLKQVNIAFEQAQKDGSKDEGRLGLCMSKFDQEQLKRRRAFSLSNISEGSWVAGGESLDGEMVDPDAYDEYGNELPELLEPARRRYSFPLEPKADSIQLDPMFEKTVKEIKKAADDYLLDNVYTDVAIVHSDKPLKKRKTVSRRTQTYLRELLHLEGDELHESDMEIMMEDEAEIDQDYTAGLISNVIQGLSEESEDADKEMPKKKKKTEKFSAKKEIPDFELADIMGEFEIDDLGNFIIIRGPSNELLDKRDRLVNRRGYLVDRFGNIINTQGNVIFKAIELDVDDEIPAPFGFQKRKMNLIKLAEEKSFNVESKQDITDNKHEDSQKYGVSDDDIEKELAQIRQHGISHEEQVEQDAANDIDLANEERMIDRITKRKVPKQKSKMKKIKMSKPINNPPPRRIGAGDVNNLFPMLGIENDEQRRLAKIATSIGGMTNQMMMGSQSVSNTLTNNQSALLEQERLEQIKQDTLKDIIADRPQTQVGIRPSGSSQYGRSRGTSAISGNRVQNNDMQKIYGNINDVVGFEESHLTELMQPRKRNISPNSSSKGITSAKRRGRSGHPETRLRGLETVYMQKSAGRAGQDRSGHNPFRPTLNQFESDPQMYNVDTEMNEFGHGRRDASLEIADRLDKLQMHYLQNNKSSIANTGQYVMSQTALHPTGNMSALGPVKNNNWLDKE